MKFRDIFMVFTLQMLHFVQPQDNFMQYFMEQTNFLFFNSSQIIEDTMKFLPAYDFIIIGSGSGGRAGNDDFVSNNINFSFYLTWKRFSDGQPTE